MKIGDLVSPNIKKISQRFDSKIYEIIGNIGIVVDKNPFYIFVRFPNREEPLCIYEENLDLVSECESR